MPRMADSNQPTRWMEPEPNLSLKVARSQFIRTHHRARMNSTLNTVLTNRPAITHSDEGGG